MSTDPHAAPDVAFRPPWLLRHPQIQSILATKSPRRRRWLARDGRMEAACQPLLLDAGDGVRLAAYWSPQAPAAPPRGRVVLIHGWEGSHASSYLYSMACTVYAAGFDVLRLNLRDHGGTHHLNREFFHSARIAEVLGAIAAAPVRAADAPLYVIGFSLGGNFSLRVGLHGPAAGVHPRLAIGISPAINPRATMQAIDDGPTLFRWYFTGKWRKTVQAKKAAWPELEVAHLLGERSLVAITRHFAERHTEYGALDPYFAAYTLDAAQLYASPTPLAIITAADDPVIPVADFAGLRAQGALRAFDLTRYGGHCGFFDAIAGATWAERRVLQLLDAPR
ncbi:YheT family hydrolase [Solimonas flava]|uniref:YheT family hydrolase n=1 Tax=Solimonas flava TaxID=415849 RepID=UPI0003FFFDEF|nr:alpha/beta fold hydrolase [Solimonas flava]